MVLYLEEFQNEMPKIGGYLNYYDKLPEYLHEMLVEDIMKHINRHGVRSWYLQQHAVSVYFMWLHRNYGINLVEKFYEFKQKCKEEQNYIGFFNLEDLKHGIEQALIKVESENSVSLPDYSGLKAIFFLEWYGVLPESAVTIQLSDVSNDGKKVYVPAENRTVNITDDGVARYFSEYKAKTGFVVSSKHKAETPYRQQTFYRNTSRRGDITIKTIYNIRLRFIQGCEDSRFKKKRVYYSGRYYTILQTEQQLGREFSSADGETCRIIKDIIGKDVTTKTICDILREYRVYREEYIDRM